MLLNSLLLTGSALAALANGDAVPTVKLDYGTFVGVRDNSAGIISFLGVRFADAPVGDLRWRAPVSPPSKHLGLVDASQFGDICVQATQTSIEPGTSEDCLFGNVYIPINKTSDQKLPVMIWFHGGGYQVGSTHDNIPNPLLQPPSSPLIFVSFEYRLGQFGFLGGTKVKEDGTLNAGLLDQRAALRWVQRYIDKFGGDKSRVTIWGQSAGAGSTMFHILAEGGRTDGLFRAAMGDSPPLTFLPDFTDTYVEQIFDQVASFAGCGSESDVMKCLREADGNDLARAGSQTLVARPATLFTFAPIVDGSFIKEGPVEAFRNGHFARVPVFFGSNTNEGANWSASLSDASANTSMPNATQTTVYNFLHGQYASLTRASFDRAVTDFYPLSDFANFSLQGQQMYGEMRYICTAGLITGAAFDRKIEGFQYHYDNPILGSDHAAELVALFESPTPADQDDRNLFKIMREFWTSFVVGQDPIAKDSPVAWEPVAESISSPRLLLHPGDVEMENLTAALSGRCAFWHSISEELNV